MNSNEQKIANEAIKELNLYIDSINNLNTKTAFNYTYEYYEIIPEGGMQEDALLTHKLGNSREGYEKYKSTLLDNDNFVDVGVTTIRAVKDRNTKEIQSYIFETTKSNNEVHEKVNDIYRYALDDAMIILGVVDREMFVFYLSKLSVGGWTSSETAKADIELLIETVEDYFEDAEFKAYLDKIIK